MGWTAVAAVAGAPYGFVVIAFALQAAAAAIDPRLFAVAVNGDYLKETYSWEGWALIGLALVLGVLMLLSLVRTVLGSEGARLAALLWLIVTVPMTAAIVHGNPRCSYRSYSDSRACLSTGASTLRDTILFGLPAIVALAAIARVEWLERGPIRVPA
jgi:hypothetical protein